MGKKVFLFLICLTLIVATANAVVQIQLRRDVAADWTSNDPVLADGEMGVETDTNKFKVGNGSDSWTELDYQTGTGSGITGLNTGYVTKAGSSTTVIDSVIYQSGSNVGIGSTSPRGELDLGTGSIYGDGSHLTGISSSGGLSGLTPGMVIKAGSSTTGIDSSIYDNGVNVGIGSTIPRGKLDVAGDIYTDGAIYLGSSSGGYVDLNNNAAARFYETTANGTNYAALIAPASLSANTIYTLPSADGTSGQALVTNGSGALSFADAGGGAGTAITVGNTNATVADTGSDGNFKVTTEGTERIHVSSTGTIGIGLNTNLSSKVTIKQTSSFDGGGVGGGFAICRSGSNTDCVKISASESSGGGGIIQSFTEGATYNPLTINPSGGTVYLGSTHASDGGLLIGNLGAVFPRSKLDVRGAISTNGNVGIGTAAASSGLVIGAGTPSGATGATSAYIAGNLEVDGSVYVGTSQALPSGTCTSNIVVVNGLIISCS